MNLSYLIQLHYLSSVVFNGYFITEPTNLITGFYPMNNNIPNYSTNLLLPPGSITNHIFFSVRNSPNNNMYYPENNTFDSSGVAINMSIFINNCQVNSALLFNSDMPNIFTGGVIKNYITFYGSNITLPGTKYIITPANGTELTSDANKLSSNYVCWLFCWLISFFIFNQRI